MDGVRDGRRAPCVGVDHSTLEGEPADTETHYTVALTGPVDDRWIEAYRIAQADSTGFRRFRLDRGAKTVSFTCRAVEGPAQVFEVLERLEALVKLANQQAGRR